MELINLCVSVLGIVVMAVSLGLQIAEYINSTKNDRRPDKH